MLKLRHLLILSILCILALAQNGMGQSLTLVQDIVENPDGSVFNGTLTLTWVGGSGSSVAPTSTNASVISGLFSVLLQPTTPVTPCAYYSATFVTSSGDASYTMQWFVPPSSLPQSIADVSMANSACAGLSPPPTNPQGGIPPALTVTSSLTFATQSAGTTSAPQGAVISSTGLDAVNFSSFSIAGTNASDFAISSKTCGSSLPDSNSCLVYVVFTPTAAGARSAQLQIADNVSGSPQIVQLSGTGQAGLTITPSLTFAAETVASTSAAQTATIQNLGTIAYSFSGFTLAGANASDYAISANTCGGSVGATSSCAVSVTFTPTGPGIRTASLQITDTAPGSPQAVSITGTGLGSSLTVTSGLAFPATGMSTTSAPLGVSIQNTGGAPVTFSSIAFTGTNPGDFAFSGNTCGGTVTAGASCQLSVTFSPQATGSRTASITITDNATNTPQTVMLTGTGATTTLSLPSTITFGSQYLSTTSAAQPVSLQNTGSVTAVLNTFSLTGANAGDFAISANTCATTLAAGASCQVSITFSPLATGTRSASLQITDSASNSPQTAPISGTGLPAALTITPSLAFGAQGIGVTSSSQTVLVQNAGTLTITLAGLSLAGANPSDFAISSTNCGASLVGGASCQVVVTFTPGSAGAFAASLQIGNSGSPNPVVSSLSGTGVGVALTVTPQLTFAAQVINSTSASQAVTVQNAGTAAAGLTTFTITGANAGAFAISSNTCGAVLPSAASCQINVTFTPQAVGSLSATLQIAGTATNSPQTVPLNGTGLGAQLTFTPALAFGTVTLGTTSVLPVNIQNTGGLAVTLSGYSIAGADPGDFYVSSTTCPASLAVGSSCQANIEFAPVATEGRAAILQIANGTSVNPLTVLLTGTGSITLPLQISQVAGLAADLAASTGNTVNVTFIDAETPGGAMNGANAAFTLAQTPNPAPSLEIFRNGILQHASNDYTLSGSTITFTNIPLAADILVAYYRVNGPAQIVYFSDAETPMGLINGFNTSFTLVNTPTGGLRVFKNGVLLNTGSDYTATGATLTFTNTAIPNPTDTLLAFYRY
jgi:Abnormal spindle-like microcephaly-assoc'd, ASPM-SPD-2-Hydin